MEESIDIDIDFDVKIEPEEFLFDEPEGYTYTPSSSSVFVRRNCDCVFCGTIVNMDKYQQVNQRFFCRWDKRCWESLGKLFNVEETKNSLIEKCFRDSKLCSKCNYLIRDIEFTLKCVFTLQKRLEKAQENVKTLLTNNFNSKSSSDWGPNNLTKALYELLASSSSENQGSNVQSNLQFQSIETPLSESLVGEDNGFYSRKLRCTRRNSVPNPTTLQAKNDFSNSGSDNYGSDSDDDIHTSPQMQMKLYWGEEDDLEKEVDEIESNISSPPSQSDSEDEDWRSSKDKRKKINNKKSKFVPTPSTGQQKSKSMNSSKTFKSTKFNCTYDNCQFLSSSAIILNAHVQKVHLGDQVPFHCLEEGCGMKFASKSGLWDHKLRKHGGGEGAPEKTVPCSVCDRKFFHFYEMRKHLESVHANLNKLRCSKCGKMFDSETGKSELEAHENLHTLKLNTTPFACVFCDTDCANITDLSKHVKAEHELCLAENKCEICKKVYDSKRKLQRHIKEIHKERNPTFKCSHCGYVANHKSGLKIHERTHSTEPGVTCHLCGNSYKLRSGLSYHLRVAHGEKSMETQKVLLGDLTSFHCLEEGCGMKFASKSGFVDHKLRKHGGSEGEPEKTVPCSVCDRKFFHFYEMRKHLECVHANWDKLRCSKCGKMFDGETGKNELEVHENLHSLKLNTTPFACVLCDTHCTNMTDLSKHVKTEHEICLAENKCNICKKVYDSKRKLQRHITEIHKERNPTFKCSHCNYIARHKSGLKIHERTHSTEPGVTCHICGNSYKVTSGLSYHLRVAHGEKNKEKRYSCSICGKNFNGTNMLKSHEESHNIIKSYVCNICEKRFKAKKNLHQHMRSHSDIKVRYGKRYRNKEKKTSESQLPTSLQSAQMSSPSTSYQITSAPIFPASNYSLNPGRDNRPSSDLLSRAEVTDNFNYYRASNDAAAALKLYN